MTTNASFPQFFRLIVALLLVGSGCGGSGAGTPAPAPIKIRVAQVETKVLRPSFDLMGVVLADPERQSTVTASTPGLVVELNAHEGDRVKKGALLASLDERKARIDLERATAAFSRLTAPPRAEELSQAEALVAKAKAAHELSSRRLAKSLELKKRSPELVPDVQLLDDRRLEEAAQADLDTTTAQLELLKKGPREEQRREARVEVEAAQLQLDLCRITAPFDGDVVELLARVGMRADIGTPIARLVDTSDVIVQTRIPGNRLASITRAMRERGERLAAAVTSSSLPGEQFSAREGWLSQQTEVATSDISAKLRVENASGLLRVGMSVRVTVHGASEEGLAVPVEAISMDEEGHHVVTVVRDGTAEPARISLEADGAPETRADGFVLVRSGLAAGAMVAVENGYALPAGTPVEVVSSVQALDAKTPTAG